MEKQYACIDLKSYYASVECVDRGLDPMITNLVVADGNSYTKRKWIDAGKAVPAVGSKLTVLYCSDKPGKAKIL